MRIALLAIALGACSSFTVATTEPPPGDDAGADAGATPPSSAERFCERAPRPTHCADYEGDALGEWKSGPRKAEVPGGVLARENGSQYEGTFGLHARLPRSDLGTLTESFQEYRAAAGLDAFLEARVRVRKPARWTKGVVAFLELKYPDAKDATVQAQLVPGPDEDHARVQVYARGSNAATEGLLTVPYGSWLDVRLEARLVGPGDGDGRVEIAGVGPIITPITRVPSPGAVTLSRVGLAQYQHPNDAALDVDYDNVIGGTL